MAWNRRIPCKILKIIHNYLIFLIVLWFVLSSFQGPLSWYLIVLRFSLSNRWGDLGKSVIHQGIYGPNQGNPLQFKKSRTTTYYLYFIIIFWFTFSSFQGPQSWYLIILRFYGVRDEVLWEKCRPLRQIQPESGELFATHSFTIKNNILYLNYSSVIY